MTVAIAIAVTAVPLAWSLGEAAIVALPMILVFARRWALAGDADTSAACLLTRPVLVLIAL